MGVRVIKYMIIIINSILVYLIAEFTFSYFSEKPNLFALDIAPAGVVFIYAIGYLMIWEINSLAIGTYRFLVGFFVLVAMGIHATTIQFFLDGSYGWKNIATIISIITLLSTYYLVPRVAELGE